MFRKPPATPSDPAPEPLWDPKARAGGRGRHLGVKWTLTALIALACLAVIAGSFRPVHKTVNVLPDEGSSAVGQYVAAFVTDWFTWDEKRPDDRAARLSVYSPNLRSDGWDKRGVQRVTQAQVFSEEPVDGQVKRVTVRVQVDTSPAAFYVQVLAAGDAQALAVLSAPALVPAPALLDLPVKDLPTTTEQDSALAKEISEQVTLFARAWATADPALSQFLLEGAKVHPVGGGLTLADVDKVAVPAVPEGADPDRRTVVVSISWQWPAGGRSLSHYEVDIQRSSGKWFVTALRGGVPNPNVAPAGAEVVAPEPDPKDLPAAEDETSKTAAPSPEKGSQADQGQGVIESEGLIEGEPFNP